MATFLSPAAPRASPSAASIPSVTKVYVVPPCMGREADPHRPHPVTDGDSGSGDEPVKRHRDFGRDLARRNLTMKRIEASD